jgi:hypothetical protein
VFVEQSVQFTIFLPTVESVSDASGMMQHKLRVTISGGEHVEFVMWGIRVESYARRSAQLFVAAHESPFGPEPTSNDVCSYVCCRG